MLNGTAGSVCACMLGGCGINLQVIAILCSDICKLSADLASWYSTLS